MTIHDIGLIGACSFFSAGAAIVADVAIPDLPNWIGNLPATGILGWYAYYTTTKTIPNLVREFREELAAHREADRQDRERERQADREDREKDREMYRNEAAADRELRHYAADRCHAAISHVALEKLDSKKQ